jgi:16S rRNA C967 or C1407 C5-methylase (RsmB/RsmF family)
MIKKKKLPKKLMELIDCYSGEESWEELADCFDVEEEAGFEINNKYHVTPTVAKVIEWHIGKEYAEQWFNREIPVLYGYKPIDLIKSYKDGEICLRVILRRMH